MEFWRHVVLCLCLVLLFVNGHFFASDVGEVFELEGTHVIGSTQHSWLFAFHDPEAVVVVHSMSDIAPHKNGATTHTYGICRVDMELQDDNLGGSINFVVLRGTMKEGSSIEAIFKVVGNRTAIMRFASDDNPKPKDFSTNALLLTFSRPIDATNSSDQLFGTAWVKQYSMSGVQHIHLGDSAQDRPSKLRRCESNGNCTAHLVEVTYDWLPSEGPVQMLKLTLSYSDSAVLVADVAIASPSALLIAAKDLEKDTGEHGFPPSFCLYRKAYMQEDLLVDSVWATHELASKYTRDIMVFTNNALNIEYWSEHVETRTFGHAVGNVSVDNTQFPRWIDIDWEIIDTADQPTGTYRGIYDIVGDLLSINLSPPHLPRPQTFTVNGSSWLLQANVKRLDASLLPLYPVHHKTTSGTNINNININDNVPHKHDAKRLYSQPKPTQIQIQMPSTVVPVPVIPPPDNSTLLGFVWHARDQAFLRAKQIQAIKFSCVDINAEETLTILTLLEIQDDQSVLKRELLLTSMDWKTNILDLVDRSGRRLQARFKLLTDDFMLFAFENNDRALWTHSVLFGKGEPLECPLSPLPSLGGLFSLAGKTVALLPTSLPSDYSLVLYNGSNVQFAFMRVDWETQALTVFSNESILLTNGSLSSFGVDLLFRVNTTRFHQTAVTGNAQSLYGLRIDTAVESHKVSPDDGGKSSAFAPWLIAVVVVSCVVGASIIVSGLLFILTRGKRHTQPGHSAAATPQARTAYALLDRPPPSAAYSVRRRRQ